MPHRDDASQEGAQARLAVGGIYERLRCGDRLDDIQGLDARRWVRGAMLVFKRETFDEVGSVVADSHGGIATTVIVEGCRSGEMLFAATHAGQKSDERFPARRAPDGASAVW